MYKCGSEKLVGITSQSAIFRRARKPPWPMPGVAKVEAVTFLKPLKSSHLLPSEIIICLAVAKDIATSTSLDLLKRLLIFC